MLELFLEAYQISKSLRLVHLATHLPFCTMHSLICFFMLFKSLVSLSYVISILA